MPVVEVVGVVAVALATVAAGTVAHELSHAVGLRALGVAYDVEWLPASDASGLFGVVFYASLARVTPRAIPPGVSPLGLRLAAVAPFALATPALLVVVGVLPDPVASGNAFLAAAAVAWLGCALPSPQDFSLFWHAEAVVDGRAGTPPPGR